MTSAAAQPIASPSTSMSRANPTANSFASPFASNVSQPMTRQPISSNNCNDGHNSANFNTQTGALRNGNNTRPNTTVNGPALSGITAINHSNNNSNLNSNSSSSIQRSGPPTVQYIVHPSMPNTPMIVVPHLNLLNLTKANVVHGATPITVANLNTPTSHDSANGNGVGAVNSNGITIPVSTTRKDPDPRIREILAKKQSNQPLTTEESTLLDNAYLAAKNQFIAWYQRQTAQKQMAANTMNALNGINGINVVTPLQMQQLRAIQAIQQIQQLQHIQRQTQALQQQAQQQQQQQQRRHSQNLQQQQHGHTNAGSGTVRGHQSAIHLPPNVVNSHLFRQQMANSIQSIQQFQSGKQLGHQIPTPTQQPPRTPLQPVRLPSATDTVNTGPVNGGTPQIQQQHARSPWITTNHNAINHGSMSPLTPHHLNGYTHPQTKNGYPSTMNGYPPSMNYHANFNSMAHRTPHTQSLFVHNGPHKPRDWRTYFALPDPLEFDTLMLNTVKSAKSGECKVKDEKRGSEWIDVFADRFMDYDLECSIELDGLGIFQIGELKGNRKMLSLDGNHGNEEEKEEDVVCQWLLQEILRTREQWKEPEQCSVWMDVASFDNNTEGILFGSGPLGHHRIVVHSLFRGDIYKDFGLPPDGGTSCTLLNRRNRMFIEVSHVDVSRAKARNEGLKRRSVSPKRKRRKKRSKNRSKVIQQSEHTKVEVTKNMDITKSLKYLKSEQSTVCADSTVCTIFSVPSNAANGLNDCQMVKDKKEVVPSLEFLKLCELMQDNFDPTKDTESIPSVQIRDDIAYQIAERLRLNPDHFGAIPGPRASHSISSTPTISPSSTMPPPVAPTKPPSSFPVPTPPQYITATTPSPRATVINLSKHNIGNGPNGRNTGNPTILLHGNNQWHFQYRQQNHSFQAVQSMTPNPYGIAPRFRSNVASSSGTAPGYVAQSRGPQHSQVGPSQPSPPKMFQNHYLPRSHPRGVQNLQNNQAVRSVQPQHRKIPNPTSWNVGGM